MLFKDIIKATVETYKVVSQREKQLYTVYLFAFKDLMIKKKSFGEKKRRGQKRLFLL